MASMFSLDSVQKLVAQNLTTMPRLRIFDIACAIGGLLTLVEVVQLTRRRLKTTALRGPPNPSFLLGIDQMLLSCPDTGAQYEKWAEEYGGVYEVPIALGGKQILLCDPKAVAHMFAGEPYTYVLPTSKRIGAETFTGKGIVTAVGESHRRQRKALTPAFSSASIRSLTPIFYDLAYKAKGGWDSLIESNGGRSAMIEVQGWMNHIALDAIGMAGFSHDFGSLEGKPAAIEDAFAAFGTAPNLKNIGELIGIVAIVIPVLQRFPSPMWKHLKALNDAIGGIADELISKARTDKNAGTMGEREEKSLLGFLIKAENNRLSREEVIAQAKILLFAGYETTSIGLTWALIELARNPDMQNKLRAELFALGTDPTYEQLFTGLPYLDALLHETFRVHSPVSDFLRMTTKDDVMPLSKPVYTRSGELVDHIKVAKGTYVMASAWCMHRSVALWGPDAKEFRPERWLTEDGIPAEAKEIQGQRHLLSWLDGPRTCLGKGFSLVEFKVVLAVLVKNFVIEFDAGPKTPIEMAGNVFPRPRVAGRPGIEVPLRVRRFNE